VSDFLKTGAPVQCRTLATCARLKTLAAANDTEGSYLLAHAEGEVAVPRLHHLCLGTESPDPLQDRPMLSAMGGAQLQHVASPKAVLQVLHRSQAAQAAGPHDADLRAQSLAFLHAVRRQQNGVTCTEIGHHCNVALRVCGDCTPLHVGGTVWPDFGSMTMDFHYAKAALDTIPTL